MARSSYVAFALVVLASLACGAAGECVLRAQRWEGSRRGGNARSVGARAMERGSAGAASLRALRY